MVSHHISCFVVGARGKTGGSLKQKAYHVWRFTEAFSSLPFIMFSTHK